MATRMYRTQILLLPQQQRALAEMARLEGRSISDLVREMIQQQLDQRAQSATADRQRQLAALERIREQREEMLRQRQGKPIALDVVELIQQMREERDERNLGDLRRSG